MNKQIFMKWLKINILTKNGFMALLYFIASLFFLAPLIAIISGTFYSLGILSAIDHFVKGEIWYPLWSSLVLISIEVSFILLTSLELGLKFGGIEVRSKKKNDVSSQKYAGYLCNTHLSESKGAKMGGSVQQKGCICELGLDIPMLYAMLTRR